MHLWECRLLQLINCASVENTISHFGEACAAAVSIHDAGGMKDFEKHLEPAAVNLAVRKQTEVLLGLI